MAFLNTLQDFDNRFPGFEHEIHRIDYEKGLYMMYCINELTNFPKTGGVDGNLIINYIPQTP